jgi:lipopolysaccharide export system permease protein
MISGFNPMAATALKQYDKLSNRYISGKGNVLSVSKGGLWMREKHNDMYYIVRARYLDQDNMSLHDVTLFVFDTNHRFLYRLDADSAELAQHQWNLHHVTKLVDSRKLERYSFYYLPTNLVMGKIYDNFSSPESIPIWELREFIQHLKDTGFSGNRHLMYFYHMIVTPVFFVAMVLIASAFSLRSKRYAHKFLSIELGVIIGFIMYFINNVIYNIGLNSGVSLALVIATPIVASCLIGIALVLHLEDG